jgi:TRAP-type C4-dicarboxylate transport system permease small subunit
LKLKKIRNAVSKGVSAVSWIPMVMIFALVFIVAIDVIMRKLDLGNIYGSNEMTEYFLVWICLLSIPVLQIKDGHIWVEMFVNRLPYRLRCFWRGVIMTVETALIGLLTVGGWREMTFFLTKHSATDTLRIPKWIFAAAAFVGFLELFLLSLIDTIQLFADGSANKKDPESKEDGWSDSDVMGI